MLIDRAALSAHLAPAKRYCEQGAEHVDKQARLVAVLERARRDTTEARRMLAEFQAWYARQLAERERLQQLLAGV